MKVLVTGANGFIGSNVVKRLLKEGFEVHALVRKTSDLKFLHNTAANCYIGDITDEPSLVSALKGVEKVFHIAGLAADWGPYSLFENINFRGTINVAKKASDAGVKRFIYISTVAFHGFGKTNMTEKSPPAKHLIPYAKTKYRAEQWLWNFAKNTNMEITAIRPGNVFGMNDRTFISKYIDALIKGKFAEINHGKSKTCPVYIENLVDIIMIVAKEKKAVNNAYIATDGLDITWHEFNTTLAHNLNIQLPNTSIPYGVAMVAAKVYNAIYNLLGIKAEPFITPYRVNNGGKDYHFSINKLYQHFEYMPKINIDEAMKRTVKWYMEKKR